MSEREGHPPEIRADIAAARRLAKWNIAWSTSVVVAMGLVMGSSQAMKTAWVEDLLALVPPIVFLFATHWERKGADENFHYGYDRGNSLGFLVAAVALGAVGVFLAKEAVTALVTQHHVTIGTVRVLGRDIWLGWLMFAAQAYAILVPVIIARKEMPLAKKLSDKLIHTDAQMKKADWQTGVAGIVGIGGLGLGFWWADAAAALVISVSVIRDGWKAMKIAAAELVDGIPHELGGEEMAAEAVALRAVLEKRFPQAERIALRETGRFIRAEVIGARPDADWDADKLEIEGCEDWRIDSIAFRP